MTYVESGLEKKFSDIRETELVAKSPEYGEENDVYRKPKILNCVPVRSLNRLLHGLQ